jgi:hypothetical protein
MHFVLSYSDTPIVFSLVAPPCSLPCFTLDTRRFLLPPWAGDAFVLCSSACILVLLHPRSASSFFRSSLFRLSRPPSNPESEVELVDIKRATEPHFEPRVIKYSQSSNTRPASQIAAIAMASSCLAIALLITHNLIQSPSLLHILICPRLWTFQPKIYQLSVCRPMNKLFH